MFNTINLTLTGHEPCGVCYYNAVSPLGCCIIEAETTRHPETCYRSGMHPLSQGVFPISNFHYSYDANSEVLPNQLAHPTDAAGATVLWLGDLQSRLGRGG